MSRVTIPGQAIVPGRFYRPPGLPTRSAKIREILNDDETFATSILLLAADALGDMEFAQWHPSTVRKEVEAAYGTKLRPIVFDKLMGAITIVTTDIFYQNLRGFVKLCDVLSGNSFDPTSAGIADAMECGWAVAEAALLSPPEIDQPFSEEIQRYIGAVLDDEGFDFTPKILKIAIREEEDKELYTYDDDPELFSSIHQNKQAQADDLDEAVAELLNELVAEIEQLPLSNGDTKDLAKRLQRGLRN